MKNRFFWFILHFRYCFKTTKRLYRKMEGVFRVKLDTIEFKDKTLFGSSTS